MKLICALGNCGDKYLFTRHNMGFMFADYFASQLACDFRLETKLQSYILKTNYLGEQIIIIKPTTFMNLSGQALSAVMNYYKINSNDILIVYDDLSLDLGFIRFREKGSDGGHNGIKSIIQSLGKNNVFDRLKIGIGPQPSFMPSEKYVMNNFSNDELNIVKSVVQTSKDAFDIWLKDGLTKAQSKYNGCVL